MEGFVMGEDLFKKKMIENFRFYSTACLIYAIFFVICLYKNDAGITFPLWTAGTCFFSVLMLKKSDVAIKPVSWFYMVVMMLMGISICLTGDRRIIVTDKFMILFLMLLMLLSNFYDTGEWKPVKYIEMMFSTVIISLGSIGRPFTDGSAYKRTHGAEKTAGKNVAKYILIGCAASIPLVCIVLVLLANADAVFAGQLRKIFVDLSFWKIFGNILGMAAIGFIIYMVSYMWMSWLGRREYAMASDKAGTGEPVIGITIMSILSFIYMVFCWIQIRYLFLGGILPHSATYSSYARMGFFQLLFVSVINMLVVMLGIYCFRNNVVLNILMSVITCCTYVMIVSSATRMMKYIQYKYLTFSRIWVLFALLVIALLMVGVFINIFNRKFRLFRYAFAVIAIMQALFGFSRPDYWIAKVNTDNMREETAYEFFAETELYDDERYLAELGTDAAPVIYGCEDILKDKTVDRYVENISKYTENIGARNWNLSRFMAWKVD